VSYGYDSQGRLNSLTLTDPAGAPQPLAQNLQYLPFGPLQSFDYGNGLHVDRSFDQDYRLPGQTIPGLLQSGYQYDPAGNLTQWQDLLNSGRDQLFGYDDLDRLISAGGTYGELGYAYNATGNRLSLTEGSETRSYRYAPGSHQLQEILGATTDSRDYDAAGNTIASLIGSYRYDASNRMTGFTKMGTQAEYLYNGRGERIQKNVNGTITRYRYGENGELLGEYGAQGEVVRNMSTSKDSP